MLHHRQAGHDLSEDQLASPVAPGHDRGTPGFITWNGLVPRHSGKREHPQKGLSLRPKRLRIPEAPHFGHRSFLAGGNRINGGLGFSIQRGRADRDFRALGLRCLMAPHQKMRRGVVLTDAVPPKVRTDCTCSDSFQHEKYNARIARSARRGHAHIDDIVPPQ